MDKYEEKWFSWDYDYMYVDGKQVYPKLCRNKTTRKLSKKYYKTLSPCRHEIYMLINTNRFLWFTYNGGF